ncbi:hypothetical protein A0H81_02476 [Grifola frondosa]|uniref:Protein kinase domain-containing protein n=1 Tax=Grifola frondosa TaxID=5627 RepID=A0A1C7MLA3_GRIFR|nr:hypothetical protein A0H81_02476 [Grifola frondosa]
MAATLRQYGGSGGTAASISPGPILLRAFLGNFRVHRSPPLHRPVQSCTITQNLRSVWRRFHASAELDRVVGFVTVLEDGDDKGIISIAAGCELTLPNRGAFEAQSYMTAPSHAFEAQRFWTAYRPWLAERGYVLYDMAIGPDMKVPYWFPPSAAVSAPPPYALYHRNESASLAPWQVMWVQARFAYAQDSQGRNVAIKVIKSDSEEERIYRHLLQCSELFNPDTFANVLPPLVYWKFLTSFCLLSCLCKLCSVGIAITKWVKCRWSDRTLLGDIKTVKEIMDFITDLLRGLSFLHDQRIAHRDIAECNVMVNYYSATPPDEINELRPLLEEHRRSSKARYCIFDYNLSKQFPSGELLENYRSPSTEALGGGTRITLGMFIRARNLFMLRFVDAIPAINMLAPLIDRMTTHIVSQRFTAAQAYDFCKSIVQDLSESDLNASVSLLIYGHRSMTLQECWEKVDPEFAASWSHYRSPPVPRGIRFLYWICSFDVGAQIVSCIRRTIRV